MFLVVDGKKMERKVNFEFNQSTLSEGFIFVSKMIREDFPDKEVYKQLDFLVLESKKIISVTSDLKEKIFLLIDFFYKNWFFSCVNGVYSLSDAIWLDKVLDKKKGVPISLGMIFLHITNQLNLPIIPIIFLAQLILCVRMNGKSCWYINPTNGEILTEEILDLWIKGTISPFASLNKKDIEETENKIIIRKIFDTMKIALMEEKKMVEALKVCETLLVFNPKDPYEIRDRGLIFAHLECNHVAISDLKYFISQCPEDPVSEVIKMQIYSIKTERMIFH